MSHKLTTQLSSQEVVEVLQKIAAKLGYIQKRGTGKGKAGSIGQMLEAIAKGEVKLGIQE